MLIALRLFGICGCILFLTVVALMGPPAIANEGFERDDHESETSNLGGKAWTIKCANELENDLKMVDRMLEAIDSELRREFAAFDPDRVTANLSLTVHIHAEPNDYASAATMTVRSWFEDDRCKAELHLLAPSKHTKNDLTVVGEPKDENYFHKTLMHEYASLYMSIITRQKKGGWRFQQAPAWFVQGYPEYLGLMRTSEHSRTVTFKKYLDLIRGDRDRVGFDFGIEVRDPYVDGALLLAFMHDVYGKEKVQAILASSEASFGKSVAKELGVDLAGFEKAWNRWLDRP